MKNYIRVLGLVLAIILFTPSVTPTYAATKTSAEKLFQLGLLSNISTSELDTPLNRIVGLTMILKTLGYKNEDAEKLSKSKIFTDMIGDYTWGAGWANIGVEIHITTGTSTEKFSPGAVMSKKEFLAYQLRVLGYGTEESWENCAALSVSAGLISTKDGINDYRFTKAEAADIIYIALNSEIKNTSGITLAQQLVADGVIDEEIASDLLISTLNKPIINQITPITNNKLEIKFKNSIKTLNKNDIIIVDKYGATIKVVSTVLSEDGKQIILVTDTQKGYILHTLSIYEETIDFYSLPIDKTQPQLIAVNVINYKSIKLTFNESMEVTSVNNDYYTISGVTVTTAAFEKDLEGKSIKNSIILTTSAQTTGTSYKVLVTGITDLSGNVIDPNYDEKYFTGATVDTTKPRLISAYALNGTMIQVTFSENVTEAVAETITNYTIDGLTITKAERQSNQAIVYLTTSQQTSAYTYKLTVKQVTDLSGNIIDPSYTTYSFVGTGADTTKPIIISAISTSRTTVKVVFSEPITDATGIMEYAYYLGEALGDYPLKVEKDTTVSTGTTWILTTIPQEAIVYTLDVTGVIDYAGNILNEDSDTVTFTGTGQ